LSKNKEVNCDFCKNKYFVSNYVYGLITSGKQKTHCCSKECTDKLKIIINEEKRKFWSTLKCDYCEAIFRVKPFDYKHKLKNELFVACSRECAQKLMGLHHSGENNPKYVEKPKNTCAFCGKEYEIYEGQIGINRYCSKECQCKDKTKNATVTVQCEYCGEDFQVLKGQISFWGVVKYCSKECRSLGTRNRANMECVICGKPYIVSNNRRDTSICCSKACLAIWISTIYSERPEVKDRLRKQGTNSQLNQKKEFTIPEMLVGEKLNELGINFIPQYVVGDMLIIDFFLPDYNCCLEVYGDYWHANPLKYGKDKKELSEMQIKNKQKDIRKYKILTKKYNYYFYSLWENDIKNDLDNCIDKFFKHIDFKIRNE